MSNREVKLNLIEELFNTRSYIKQVNDYEYRTRCEFCGDSDKNPNTGHMYIHINPNDNMPMVYHCFKCESSGIVDSEFLSIMELGDSNMKSSVESLNKTADKIKAQTFINGDKTIIFDYKLPEIKRGKKTKYIEERLGKSLTDEELKNLKVITSFREFLILNKIKELLVDNNSAVRLENNYVGFLSYGGSHILFRDITGKEQLRWIKYPITNESKQCRLFYSMESVIDIFTKEKIKINLAEGVLDIASCALNLENNKANCLNIAVCGKHYTSILNRLLLLGIVGDNVELNIYADNDAEFNHKNNNPTTIKYFNKLLYKYKHLYGRVNIYYNILEKDIGVPKNRISLKKYTLN